MDMSGRTEMSPSEQEALPASPGARLARAREARGMSVEDVSRYLKLTPAQVLALETDDYSSLPSIVFVRGFLRSYAKLVDADITALLPGRPASSQTAPAPTLQQQATEPVHQTTRRPLWIGLFAAGCVIAALTYYEFVINVPVQPPAAQPVSPSPAPAKPAKSDSAPIAATAAPPSGTSATKDTAPQPAVLPQAPPSERTLHFVFKRDSWVEVIDGEQTVLLAKKNYAGGERKLTGKPPFKLVVGAASSVELRYDGVAVDLPSYTSTSDVARFVLE